MRVSAVNRANTCNRPLGDYLRVFVSLEAATWRQWLSYDDLTHSMDKIVHALHPTSGKALLAVKDWPSIYYEQKSTSQYKVMALLQIVKNYALGADKDEFDEFFKWADKLNEYNPNPQTLSYEQGYFAKYRAHYQVSTFDTTERPLNRLNAETAQFLVRYELLRNYAPQRVNAVFQGLDLQHAVEQLAHFTLQERLLKDNRTQLILKADEATWQYIYHLTTLVPNLLEKVNAVITQTLPDVAQSIKNLETQMQALLIESDNRPTGARFSIFAKGSNVTTAQIDDLQMIDNQYDFEGIDAQTAIQLMRASNQIQSEFPQASFTVVEEGANIGNLIMNSPKMIKQILKMRPTQPLLTTGESSERSSKRHKSEGQHSSLVTEENNAPSSVFAPPPKKTPHGEAPKGN